MGEDALSQLGWRFLRRDRIAQQADDRVIGCHLGTTGRTARQMLPDLKRFLRVEGAQRAT